MFELSDVATRVDKEKGFREEVSFPMVGGKRIFSVAHLPLRPAEAGLVICPPILMELLKNYRHEVLLARVLASRGIAVQRFHYRGTGHSDGEESEVGAETMVEDALAAAERLQRQHEIRSLAFLGTRWGAHVAAAVARGYPGAPLVFWEPVVEADRYFRDLIRARLIRETKDPRFAQSSLDGEVSAQTTRWKEEMARDGRADILGYPLYQRFYDSVKTRQLGEILTDGVRRPVLLVQMSRRNILRPELMKLKRAIELASGTCEVNIIRDEPGWMFDSHRMNAVPGLLQATADWLTAQIGVVSNA